jgi:hypothetical protein
MLMEYPIVGIPGFEGRTIMLRPAGVFSSVKLIVDNEVLKPKWGGKFTLLRADGTPVEARLRSNLVDPIPQLVVDKQVYLAAKPLPWYQLVWSAIPILLFFAGGVVGVILGLLAAYANTRIFRSDLQPVLKYVVTALVTIATLVVVLVLAGLLSLALQQG